MLCTWVHAQVTGNDLKGEAQVAGVLLTVSVPYEATAVFVSLLVFVYSEPLRPLRIPTLQGEKVLPSSQVLRVALC